MMKKTLPLVLVTLMCSLVGSAFADDSPYYTVYRTWALAPPGAETPGKIITFLPRRYLLYVENRNDFVKVAGHDYVQAITQDGTKVLVFEESISKKTFRISIGEHEVIFNIAFQLCKTIGCDPDEYTAVPVERGDAFKIKSEENGFYKLEGTRPNGPFQGYISIDRLAQMKTIGQITRADDPTPRYKIEKTKSTALTTECGEVKVENSISDILDGERSTARILKQIPLASVFPGGQKIRFLRAFGEENYMYNFYLYTIEDQAQEPGSARRSFYVSAAFKIHCRRNSLGTTQMLYIDTVNFVSDQQPNEGELISDYQQKEVEFTIDEFGTPKNLIEKTGAPYMISINNESHFNRALEIISLKIADRTLAGYILSEINRSCRSSERKAGSNSPCLGYSY